MASLSYFVREATTSLRRGGASNVLAIATIALALFVLGAFLLVTGTLDRLMAGWSASAEMSVYLRDDVSDDQRAAIWSVLGASTVVESRQFVSKTDAARRFRRDFPDLASVAEGLGSNPLPASFELRLRPSNGGSAGVDRLAGSMAQMGGVADVRYDRQWLDRLARIVGALRWIGLVLASALAVAAGLTVAAVVRLAMAGRHVEVEIMALVGAPFSAIRGPFILEGVLQGGIGAILALAVLRVAYEVARLRVVRDIPGLDPSSIAFLSPLAMVGIVGGGVIVGCLGGFVATRGVR
jgi:cell division transport system permease protein